MLPVVRGNVLSPGGSMIKHYLPFLRIESVDFALDCFCAFAFGYIAVLWLMG
jgi:hypothetical protein